MIELGKDRRRITPISAAAFQPFDLYGEPLPKLSWLPLNFDASAGRGHYLLRFAPGGRSLPHEHTDVEEFLVLEGELVDSDGTIFRAGDFVQFAAGSQHFSTSPSGCLLLVILHARNRPLERQSPSPAAASSSR